MAVEVKSERIQLRTSPEAKAQIIEAASISQQDATSFILDAATSRARAVLLEHKLLELSAADLRQVQAALDLAETPSPAITNLFASARADSRLRE